MKFQIVASWPDPLDAASIRSRTVDRDGDDIFALAREWAFELHQAHGVLEVEMVFSEIIDGTVTLDPSPVVNTRPGDDGTFVAEQSSGLPPWLIEDANSLPGDVKQPESSLALAVSPLVGAHFGAVHYPSGAMLEELDRATRDARRGAVQIDEVRAAARAKGIFWTPGLGFTIDTGHYEESLGRFDGMPAAPVTFFAHKEGAGVAAVRYEGPSSGVGPSARIWQHVPYPEAFLPTAVLRAFAYLGLQTDEFDMITFSGAWGVR